ncbi:cellulose biosynthesis cyclic di-GMP-binding regulatory protein BcsB [Rhizobium sp. CG5]|uniref:cellulose biosynthesis cyclic di-GMP-binding regulatory protein BcsB n=1 Tax=Rhizobium sp. CG5 TaxID=2726076 RepID=UPI0020346861|nr:cellulose biosynthesis cyclic di-GMP-binding regulatory protein BcsB [Rhizobium sp. CG5]MCM2474421.1 cellulose biosynthesis cyclic di-GMP-binding regulatory protein BcsB [Rhizobium sp. CG5]
MKYLVALLFLCLCTPYGALAQPAPFDMAPERGDSGIPAAPPKGDAPGATVTPDSDPVSGVPTAVDQPAANDLFKRYLIPSSEMVLSGERDSRIWSVYLTQGQAAAAAQLNVGYQNAIFVAPETSKLSIDINGTVLIDQQIRSPDAVSDITVAVPAGLLKPGANMISVRVDQHHRTDCSVDSTYQLWSNIVPANTYLTFGDGTSPALKTLNDIRAVGVDASGATRFHFIAPALEQPIATVPLLRLAQGLAVIANMPNQSFGIASQGTTDFASGQMKVFVGTPAELQPLLPSLPAGASAAPVATFTTDPSGASVLVVSGPTWQEIGVAIESIIGPTVSSSSTRRATVVTSPWRSPDAPMLYSGTQIPFGQLGVRTEQFSGRRLRSEFTIAVPSDFYADAYGEAVILLDAAYSEAVLPGSHIDVYVNGSIASTVPITSSGGGILRHLPVNVTMRHFRPGINVVTLEAVLMTQDDAACMPGAASSDTPRFALFDTSVFQMPDFARIGQSPNLAAIAGTGFPYNRAAALTPIFLDRLDEDTMSATATFLGRLAGAVGRPITLESVASAGLVGDRNAIFIGSLSQMPQAIFTQMSIDPASRTTWGTSAGGATDSAATEVAFDEWRQRLRGASWTGQVTAFEEWLKRNFDISLSSLRFAPTAEESFIPSDDADLMIAQGPSPNEQAIWTVITAPGGAGLKEGMQAMSNLDAWADLSGRITTYQPVTKTVSSTAVNNFHFVPTQPLSFLNARLIAANWLSTNILSYAVLLVGLSILLGLATAMLLGNFGRRQ